MKALILTLFTLAACGSETTSVALSSQRAPAGVVEIDESEIPCESPVCMRRNARTDEMQICRHVPERQVYVCTEEPGIEWKRAVESNNDLPER